MWGGEGSVFLLTSAMAADTSTIFPPAGLGLLCLWGREGLVGGWGGGGWESKEEEAASKKKKVGDGSGSTGTTTGGPGT